MTFQYLQGVSYCLLSPVVEDHSLGLTDNVGMLETEHSPGYKIQCIFHAQSAEHEILNAHEYKNIKKFSFFQVQISLEFSCP